MIRGILLLAVALAGCHPKYQRAANADAEASDVQRATAEDIALNGGRGANEASKALADGRLTEDEYGALMDNVTSTQLEPQ